MIFRDDRPMTNTAGPRFNADFDRTFAREYEREQIEAARYGYSEDAP